MSSLSCHVLNTTHGIPAVGITVSVSSFASTNPLAKGETDKDGRCRFESLSLEQGRYTLVFHTENYCTNQFGDCFFPQVEVHFVVQREAHYHVPLLLSPYSYTTYRGS